MGVIQAQAEKLNNEQLKHWKEDKKLPDEIWLQVKSHVQLVRKLKRGVK